MASAHASETRIDENFTAFLLLPLTRGPRLDAEASAVQLVELTALRLPDVRPDRRQITTRHAGPEALAHKVLFVEQCNTPSRRTQFEWGCINAADTCISAPVEPPKPPLPLSFRACPENDALVCPTPASSSPERGRSHMHACLQTRPPRWWTDLSGEDGPPPKSDRPTTNERSTSPARGRRTSALSK